MHPAAKSQDQRPAATRSASTVSAQPSVFDAMVHGSPYVVAQREALHATFGPGKPVIQRARGKQSKHDRKDRALAKASGLHYDVEEAVNPRNIAADIALRDEEPEFHYTDFRNPSQQAHHRVLAEFASNLEQCLSDEESDEARILAGQMKAYIEKHAGEIHTTDLRAFSNTLNSAGSELDGPPGKYTGGDFLRAETDDVTRKRIALFGDQVNPNYYQSGDFDFVANHIAGEKGLSSHIVYHAADGGEGLRRVMGAPPEKEGFQAREWDQYKIDYETVHGTTLQDLEQKVGVRLAGLDLGQYDFLALKVAAGLEMRFISHNDPAQVGHGSMIARHEQDAVRSGEIKVTFAGQFKINPKGHLEKWDNLSGHFRPTTISARGAPFPTEKYHSGHVAMYLKLRQDLVAKLVDWLPTKGLRFRQSDVEALVGGEEQIRCYQIVDNRAFHDKRDGQAVIDRLAQVDGLLQELDADADEMIGSYVSKGDDVDDLRDSFFALARETFEAISGNIQATMAQEAEGRQ